MDNNLQATRQKLDQISPSFCLAKWLHATVHLHSGMTHSCYHNPPHQTSLQELQNNPESLIWTARKIEQQKNLLAGERPSDCQFCWKIEAVSGSSENLSDRLIKSNSSWAMDHYEALVSSGFKYNFGPSYLEVGFSRECQMKCLYCGPQYSTSWSKEIENRGEFQAFPHPQIQQNESEFKERLKAFHVLLPQLIKNLRILRLTGGEPMLSADFWQTLEELKKHQSEISLVVNTNLSLPDRYVTKLVETGRELLMLKSIKNFKIVTSLEAVGEEAEYIRQGLNFSIFMKNFNFLRLTDVPIDLSITSTVSRLSVTSYARFLRFFTRLREEKGFNTFILDPSPLKKPDFLNIEFFDAKDADLFKNSVQNYLFEFQNSCLELEKIKLQALINLCGKTKDIDSIQQKRFELYLDETKSRYNKSVDLHV